MLHHQSTQHVITYNSPSRCSNASSSINTGCLFNIDGDDGDDSLLLLLSIGLVLVLLSP